MADPRWVDWELGNGPRFSWEAVHTALLMDIRDRLTQLKSILECPNVQDIPRQLRAINRNTRKKAKCGH